MPPMQYTAPTHGGPTQLGARQAALLDRLRQARAAQGQAGKAYGKGKNGGRGVHASELVTDFEGAMDEAYDRLLGRRGRHDDKDDSRGKRDDQREDEEKPKFPASKFPPRHFRG